jgi:Arc/MetJ-type ribon-helix-helix transcriptional regulator
MSGSKKYSISLPEDLAEAVRAHVGPGGFSSYVAEALEQRVAMDKLREIVTDFETDNDPLSRDEVGAARVLLRHNQRAAAADTRWSAAVPEEARQWVERLLEYITHATQTPRRSRLPLRHSSTARSTS